MPLLLTAYQHRFAGDVEAMSQHLIDDVDYGWSELGTDLLDGAPTALRHALTGGNDFPSSKYSDVINSDGTPAERELITQANTAGMDWGYVLHPHGVEVISCHDYPRGPVVAWNTDPRARFSDAGVLWKAGHPVPATAPPRATQPPAKPVTVTTTAVRLTTRR
ncbi:hypothetical protein ABT104_13115 [Streptomyces mobaraensis]|uniref:hypothetical protein n=1 Tax=Streptomyces mobaraensis TaxID=35621 RepID=UPI0033335DBF